MIALKSQLILCLLAITVKCPGVFDVIYEIRDRGLMENVDLLKTTYKYECMATTALGFVLMLYFWGIKKNELVAWKWYNHSIKLFEAQFEKCGVPDETRKMQQMERETNNEWKFFATGRNNCTYCLINLETKKRHDLLAMSVLSVYWPQADRVTYTIPLAFENMPKISFAILRKKLVTKFKTENPEFNHLCSTYTIDKVPDSRNYITLAENQEFVNHFVDNNLVDMQSPSKSKQGKNFDAKCIESIHISDQKTFSNEPLAMKIVFVLPSIDKMSQSQFFTEYVLKQIEKIRTYRPSQKSKDDAQNNRNGMNIQTTEDKEKEEERLDKIRDDKAAKYNSMSLAEKKKYDETQEKRFKSKMQKKIKMK